MKLEKLDNMLLIVGNLGELKIYKIKYQLDINPKDNFHTSHKHHKGTIQEHLEFELICDENFIDAHKNISDIVTDKEGHYEGPFGSASGEAHNLELTIEDRVLHLIAKHINQILKNSNYDKFIFTFPKEYNSYLLNLIDSKDKLYKNIEENLVKNKAEEIINEYIIK